MSRSMSFHPRDAAFEKLELVSDASTCRGCIHGECEDSISFDQIRFPAYRNVTSGTCWSRSTVRGVVNSEAEPRDPVTGRRWIVPPLRWDVDEVVCLMNEGRYLEARTLFARTVQYAVTWNAYEIVALHRAGLCIDAETLRLQTVRHARWCVDDVLALHKAGLGFTAWLLHRKTLKYVQKSWRIDEVIFLQASGLPVEARSLFDHTLLYAEWSTSDIIALHRHGPSRTAAQLFGTTLNQVRLVSPIDIVSLRAAGLMTEAARLSVRAKRGKS